MRILIGILLLSSAACTFSQTLPVKEGLWEIVFYKDDGAADFRTHECLTQKSFAEMITKVNSHPGCKLTSQDFSSRGITVDMSCNTSKYQLNTHGFIGALDSEHVRVTQTVKMFCRGIRMRPPQNPMGILSVQAAAASSRVIPRSSTSEFVAR
jgi:hypothetical protein